MSERVLPILPTLTDLNRPFWTATVEGRLAFQRCAACRHLRYPIAPICPRCLDARFSWEDVSGRGTVLTYATFHRAYHPAWADRVPYTVALVQTEEGPRMFADLELDPGRSVSVDTLVVVTFGPPVDGVVIPRFRPVGD